jgi:hypothetical protein
MKKSVIEKFHESYIPEPMSGCWLWTAKLRNSGSRPYGYIMDGSRLPNGKPRMELSHRYSYSVFNGTIANGNHIHHKCENTICVNPHHLESVTPMEHVHKTPGCAGYMAALATHCAKGHEFTSDNTGVTSKGGRKCIQCARNASKSYKNNRYFNRFEQERGHESVQAAKTHCPHGHEYSQENTYYFNTKSGIVRSCRTCAIYKSTLNHEKKIIAQSKKFLMDNHGVDMGVCINGHDMNEIGVAYRSKGGHLKCRLCRGSNNK